MVQVLWANELVDVADVGCQIAVGGERCIWGLSSSGSPHRWEEGQGWSIQDPPAAGTIPLTSIAVGGNGECWGTCKDGLTYRFDQEFDWVKCGDMPVTRLSVGNQARIYAIAGVRNYVWKY